MTRAQREKLERKLERSSGVAASLFDRHSPAELTRRPGQASWSAAECVVHLSLTAAAAAPLIEASVAELRSRTLLTRSPSRMDWVGRLLRWSLEPPPRFKTRTTAPFQPLRTEPLAEVLPEFMRHQARLVELVRATEGLDLAARKVASPFNPRIRYNVLAMFCVLEMHERRHLWQAERAAARARDVDERR